MLDNRVDADLLRCGKVDGAGQNILALERKMHTETLKGKAANG